MQVAPGTPRFIAAMVTAQVLTQIGAFTLPALLPTYIDAWSLSGTQAGWLIGIFFAAYVPAVPVLLALTDRVPARHIYLVGTGATALAHLGFALLADGFWSGLAFRALAGIGWAGAYMPGLKAIADPLSGTAQSRAVSWHAAGVGIAGAASFALAGACAAVGGPSFAFLVGGLLAGCAFAIALLVMPGTPPPPRKAGGRLLDFRPVLANRRAMAWIAGYCVHTLEMAVLRAWAVAFLAASFAITAPPAWLPGPTVLFTLAGLVGIAVSLSGNEASEHFGRGRVVAVAMLGGAGFAAVTGFAMGSPPLVAVAAVFAWNAAIYLDSSALTAGTVQAADPALRGATMGLHSMAGYAGGFVGPLLCGVVLDAAGGEGALAWGLAFGHVALVVLAGFAVLRVIGRQAR
ncbi:MFS transporter [Roseomonas fluvialis]|uniref:MFS transporter n=1 Tax=Roseomonas fluvialis TaxID=1750527 RepID=A0ABM7Y183_9PROT|nr:MFS transporter [Roseomonas fluvialis]BDG71548.1 MFS transporter [Roseomonas fluvialis]